VAAVTPLIRARPKPRRREGATPHDVLWDAVRVRYPMAQREYAGAVPGRRYRLDIALVEQRLAIEVDGWEWHGKHKGDFSRDRERQNQLILNGWRVLRFTAGQINRDLQDVMNTIRKAIETKGGGQ
jgi:very-short-patch-repair endonuclease